MSDKKNYCLYCEGKFEDGDLVAIDKRFSSLRYLHCLPVPNNRKSCFFRAHDDLLSKGMVPEEGKATLYVFYRNDFYNFSYSLLNAKFMVTKNGGRYSKVTLERCLKIDGE